MSLQAHYQFSLGSANRQNKKLRNVKLNMPSTEILQQRPVQSPPAMPVPQVSSSFCGCMHGHSSVSSPVFSKPKTALYTPTLYHIFPEDVEPSFVFDVLMPSNAKPFTTQPPPDLPSPKFLIYSISTNPVATGPVKLVVNGTVIRHWVIDPRPMDITKLLLPFGQQNWVIIESGGFVAPFTLIGVWAGQATMSDLIERISSKEQFEFAEVGAICPISGAQIDIPAKGAQCTHEQCFDLTSYINMSQALSCWACPICRQKVGIEDLRIGSCSNPEMGRKWDTTPETNVFEEQGGWWD